jgi:hypothetical protein
MTWRTPCRVSTSHSELPSARAASMKVWPLIARINSAITRAESAQPVIARPMTKAHSPSWTLTAAIAASAAIITGAASAALISPSNARPARSPVQPAVRPIDVPSSRRVTATTDTVSRVGRTAQSKRLSRSRPCASEPSGRSGTVSGGNGGASH